MKQVTVTVIDPVGLHARPATVAVNAASKFKSDVNVAFKGREVNMKSIMGVMSLGILLRAKSLFLLLVTTKKLLSLQSKKYYAHRTLLHN